jgi:hypothetical protein
MRRLRAGCASQTAHWGCYMNEYLGPWPNLTARRLEVCEDCYLPVSVYTLPQRIRSRGRAPASPMGFPPPLVPHINCEPRHPLSTERWDWVVCRNALWVNRLWSAIYPYRSGSKDRSLPRPLLARRQGRCYTAHRSPKGTLTSSTQQPSPNSDNSMFVNFGELSAPLILATRRPGPRPPYGE